MRRDSLLRHGGRFIIRILPRSLAIAGIAFLATTLHGVGGASEFALDPVWTAGGIGSEVGDYGVPESVVIDALGQVVVTDKGRMMLHVYDRTTGTALFDVGGLGSALGKFDRPNGIAVDAAGHVLVVEQRNQRVQVFDRDYRPLRSWGGSSRFQKPMGIAIGPDGRIYVTDEGRADIQAFAADGTFLFRFERQPSLDKVESIEVDAAGQRILVCDEGRSRVNVYDMQGQFLSSFGSQGSGPGQFGNDTNAVRLDHRRRIYVNDQGNMRINVFRPDTGFLASFRNTLGGFESADGLELSEEHNLFLVADQGHNRVVAFDLGEIQCRLARIELESSQANAIAATALAGSFDAEPRSTPTPPWADGTLYLEARITAGHAGRVESALAHVRSDRDPGGICVTLVETGPGTNVLRGAVQLGEHSDEDNARLATNDAGTVRAHLAGETTELEFEFTATTAPAVTGLAAGAKGAPTAIVNDRPRLTWQWSNTSNPAATHYEVQLCDAAGTAIWSTGLLPGSASAHTYDGPPLTPGFEYRFGVRMAAGRAMGAWATLAVRRNRPPDVAAPAAPAPGVRVRAWPPSFVIPIPHDADGDELACHVEIQVGSTSWRSPQLFALDTQWSWVPDRIIEDNTAVLWRTVVADAHDSVRGAWHALSIDAVDEDPLPPQPRAPPHAARVHGDRIAFAWDAARDPDPASQLAYTLERSPTPDFVQPLVDALGAATQFDCDAPAQDGAWYWRVRATDHSGRGVLSAVSQLHVQRTARIVLRADAPSGALQLELGVRPGAADALASEDVAAVDAAGAPCLASRTAHGEWLLRDIRAARDVALSPLVFDLRLSGAGSQAVEIHAEHVALPAGWQAALRDASGRTRDSWRAGRALGRVVPDAEGNVAFQLVLSVPRARPAPETVVPVATATAEGGPAADAPAVASPADATTIASDRNDAVSNDGTDVTSAGRRLRFAAPGSARVHVRVYDVRGRVLRRDRVAIDGTWTWDGRDGGGRRLARGVYFVRAHGLGVKTRYRVVWAG